MSEGRHWLDEPRNLRRLWHGFIVVLALTVALEWVLPLHGHFAIDSLFGFNAAYGFLACAAMIVGAKALGLLLKRPDSHYRKDHD